MIDQIRGLHHVTSMARDARKNNRFFTRVLGLRRVKTTVNFDEPSVYHLYYGDGAGTPGSVMTYFPFPNIAPGRFGTGEVATTHFAVPEGSLDFWSGRLAAHDVSGLATAENFGARELRFTGPEGDSFALVETPGDPRAPWTEGGIDGAAAIRGFRSVTLRLAEEGATAELLRFMGYEELGRDAGRLRFGLADGNGADLVDIETVPGGLPGRLGAGSVHHVAFAVPDEAAQRAVRAALVDAGYQVTPPIDRDYFHAIYFRTPGGVLFEIATNTPGFARDEDPACLGEALKLPARHEHLRGRLEQTLQPLEG